MDEYDNLVFELKKNQHETNKFYYYKITDFNNLATLTETKGQELRNESLGSITLIKTETDLVVFIATTYLGHAGGKELAYSENGNVPIWKSDEWGELWTTKSQINSNWWNLKYND